MAASTPSPTPLASQKCTTKLARAPAEKSPPNDGHHLRCGDREFPSRQILQQVSGEDSHVGNNHHQRTSRAIDNFCYCYFGSVNNPKKCAKLSALNVREGRKEGGDLIIYRKKAVPHLPSSRRLPRCGATPSREFGAGHEDFFLPVDASAMLHSERRHGCIEYTRTSSHFIKF